MSKIGQIDDSYMSLLLRFDDNGNKKAGPGRHQTSLQGEMN